MTTTPQNNISPRIENLFQTLYQLAKKKDEQALKKIVENGSCINIKRGPYSLLTFLAMEGDEKTVDFLINKFKLNRNDALKGYIIGNHRKQADDQIAQGAEKMWSIYGHAIKGRIAQVNQLIAQETDIWRKMNATYIATEGYAAGGWLKHVDTMLQPMNELFILFTGGAYGEYLNLLSNHIVPQATTYALRGFAQGGYFEQVNPKVHNDFHLIEDYAEAGYVDQVNQFILEEKNNPLRSYMRHYALIGYARGGHVEEAEKLISQGEKRYYAVEGYAAGCHIDQVNRQIRLYDDLIIRDFASSSYKVSLMSHIDKCWLMAMTEDCELRRSIAKEINTSDVDRNTLYKQASTLNRIMREYDIDYQQAKALQVKGMRSWLLEETKHVQDGQIVPDMFLNIGSFVGNLSHSDTKQVYEAVHTKNYNNMTDYHYAKFKQGLFTPQELATNLEEDQKNHANRSSLKLTNG